MSFPSIDQASSLTARRAATSPDFRAKLTEMAIPLSPLVQVTTGQVHPRFPRLFVNYWLLTEAELDDMATFYHQRCPPGCDERDAMLAWFWRAEYPVPVPWEDGASLETKRRRFGRFIGLRGCESPLADWEDRSRMDIPSEDALNKAKWYR